jgi:antitoxin HicB
MRVLTYTVVIEPAEEGGYDVHVPVLPGCLTQAETYQDAVAMARQAIEGFVEALALAGEPIPIEPQPHRATTVAVSVQAPAAA